MKLGSQNHSRDGLLGPNSMMVVYIMDPVGKEGVRAVGKARIFCAMGCPDH